MEVSIVKIVSWMVGDKKVVETEHRYPLCTHTEKDCQDMLTINGQYHVCDVYDGEFSRCPYEKKK